MVKDWHSPYMKIANDLFEDLKKIETTYMKIVNDLFKDPEEVKLTDFKNLKKDFNKLNNKPGQNIALVKKILQS